MSTKDVASVICLLTVIGLGTTVPEATAQCDPPGANTKCWDGGGSQPIWSDSANWDPDQVPLDTDDVYHLIGGTIVMDMGSLANPVPIKSFTFDVPGALTIGTGKGLLVAGAFTSVGAAPAQAYGLNVEAGAKLQVSGDLDFVSAIVPDSTEGTETQIIVGGVIRPADWSVGAFTLVSAVLGIDQSESPSGDWVIKGEVHTIGPITGAERWTLGEAGATNTPLLRLLDGSLDVGKLTVNSGAHVILAGSAGFPPMTMNIGYLLLIDGGVVQTHVANLHAATGSVVTLTGGGSLKIATVDWWTPSVISTLEYGEPGVSGNRLESKGPVYLVDDDSKLVPAQGVSGSMTVKLNNDLDIRSKIHAEASNWDSTGVDFQVFGATAAPPREIELTSPDFGGIWFADTLCIKPWKSFEIICAGAHCFFTTVDRQPHSNPFVIQQTGEPEAMYVDGDVTLHELAVLFPSAARHIYYNGTMFAPEIVDPPFYFALKTLYGDWNNDCVITEDERTALSRIVTGLDPYDPLFDFDCDGAINSPTEEARFNENIDSQFGVLPEMCVSCDAVEDCGDRIDNATGNLPSDGIRDDSCVWVGCDSPPNGACNLIDIGYADGGGPLGACEPDGFCNLADALLALDCFAGTTTCNHINLDYGAALGVCEPDGFCGLPDAMHALTCFAGTNTCSCSGGSMGAMQGPQTVGATELVAVPAPFAASANVRRVRIFAKDALDHLRAFQLHTAVSGGQAGQVELVDITIEDRADYVFAGAGETLDAFNVEKGQMLSLLVDGNVPTDRMGYLATLTYRVSADAVGTFVVDILHEEGNLDRTWLVGAA